MGDGMTASLVREPDAGNPPVRFDEGGVETEHGTATKAPATERVGQRLCPPAPPHHTSTLRFPTLVVCVHRCHLWTVLVRPRGFVVQPAGPGGWLERDAKQSTKAHRPILGNPAQSSLRSRGFVSRCETIRNSTLPEGRNAAPNQSATTPWPASCPRQSRVHLWFVLARFRFGS